MTAMHGSADIRPEAGELREKCGVFGIHGHPDAAAHTALQLRLRRTQRALRGILVAAGDRQFHGLDEGADTADAPAVDVRPAGVAADPLLGRLMMCHSFGLRLHSARKAGL